MAKSKSPISISPLTVDTKEQKKESYDEELRLYNLLREARKKAADRFMQSGYLICPDNVLREVARFKPTSKLAMLSIKGFNSRMFNKVGNDFLEIINSLEQKESKSKTQIKERELPQNIVETKKLLQNKYTLKEIAETRKLSEAVISMQIETIVEFQPDIEISSLIREEILQTILNEASKGFDNLKELKERLPSKITYPEIRIAVAKLRAASQLPSLNAPRKQ
jgi:ATP-dependent DNA helicase RecQ